MRTAVHYLILGRLVVGDAIKPQAFRSGLVTCGGKTQYLSLRDDHFALPMEAYFGKRE